MKDSSLLLAGAFLSLSLVVVGCGDGGEDTDGTGGASSGGASTGGTPSGGSSTGGGASGGTMSGGGGTGGGASLTCSPQDVEPFAEDCPNGDVSWEATEPLVAQAALAVQVSTPGGPSEVRVYVENEACSSNPVLVQSLTTQTGDNCYELVSPGPYSRVRINVAATGYSYLLCPHGACLNR